MLCIRIDIYVYRPFFFSVYIYQRTCHTETGRIYYYLHHMCSNVAANIRKKIDCFIPVHVIKTGLLFFLVRENKIQTVASQCTSQFVS